MQTNYFYVEPTSADDIDRPGPRITFSGNIKSPYRGLNSFRQQDAAFFFGRETAITEILQLLFHSIEAPGPLIISGVSGAGKSSLLQAGVLPRLAEAAVANGTGVTRWRHLLLTPSRAPVSELAAVIAPLAGTDAVALRRSLHAEPTGLALTARQAALAGRRRNKRGNSNALDSSSRLLLVVDQFEQVFTQCTDEAERHAFIAALHAAATIKHGAEQVPAAVVILVVRADFEARCAEYEELTTAVKDRYLITPMTERQIRLAVTEPARMAGSRVDDALLEELLGAMRTESSRVLSGTAVGAGILPHMSHVLDQAWRRRTDDDVLGLADYERVGGLERSIAISADRAYKHLSTTQQTACRPIFMRLVAISSDFVISAGRATKAELATGVSPADVDAILTAFADERLLTLDARYVEIAHEALLTSWNRLRTWLDSDKIDLARYNRLTADAREWDANQRSSSYVYREGRLAEVDTAAKRWASIPGRYPALSAVTQSFLDAGHRAARLAQLRRRGFIATLSALTVVAGTTAVVAIYNAADANHQRAIAVYNAANANHQRAIASQQHLIALSRQLAAQSLSLDATDPVTARRLAVAAWRVSHTSQAGSAMATLLAEQQRSSELPAGSFMSGGPGMVFSPKGTLLATADTIWLWNGAMSRPAEVEVQDGDGISGPGGHYSVTNLAFSPDGRQVATVDSQGNVRLWNLAISASSVKLLLVYGTEDLNFLKNASSVAFSPDGGLLAAAVFDESGGNVRILDLATGDPASAPLPANPVMHEGHLGENEISFSPNGKLLASADADGYISLWDPNTGKAVGKPLPVDPNQLAVVGAISFSPDGKVLASADADGYVQLWNLSTGKMIGQPLSASPKDNVFSIAFSPDGKLLASADGNGYIRLWNPVNGNPVGKPIPANPLEDVNDQGAVTGVAFSPDGKLLISADGNGYIRLWNPSTGNSINASLGAPGQSGDMNGVAFSPNGKLLASSDSNGYVQLWDTVIGAPVGKPLPSGSDAGNVAFSPDGKMLATADDSSFVRLWDVETGKLVRQLPLGRGKLDGNSIVKFSPNGDLLASADGDGHVQLWDPKTGAATGKPINAAPNDLVQGIAFSPNGKLLATASFSGYVQLWDPTTGRPIGKPIAADTGANDLGVQDVAFSPDGMLLATADGDGYVRLWDPTNGHSVGKSIPASAFAIVFSPDGRLLATADDDGYVRLWDPLNGSLIAQPLPADPLGIINDVAFNPSGGVLASSDTGGHVDLWQIWSFTDPYAALCDEVGPPTKDNWTTYAPGEPKPGVCAGVPAAVKIGA